MRPKLFDTIASDSTTLRDWLAANPPPDDHFMQSLAGVALRVVAGEDLLYAVREFLDEFAIAPRSELRQRAIDERPQPAADKRYDAYLGALAEHLALRHGLDRPDWCVEPDRFLDRFWFTSDVVGFRATLLAESPAAFKRRGVFVSERSLIRV